MLIVVDRALADVDALVADAADYGLHGLTCSSCVAEQYRERLCRPEAQQHRRSAVRWILVLGYHGHRAARYVVRINPCTIECGTSGISHLRHGGHRGVV